MQGFKGLRENSTYKLSPEGTAESAQDASPGLGKSQEQSRQGRLRMSQDASPGRIVSSRVESSALLAIPGLASCDFLSRPWRDYS